VASHVLWDVPKDAITLGDSIAMINYIGTE